MLNVYLFAKQILNVKVHILLCVTLTSDHTSAQPAVPSADPNLEAQIFAVAATVLCDVGKISLAPPPLTPVLDPHLNSYNNSRE